MPSYIETLPYEVLSVVLEISADLNIRNNAQFTYGLSQAPEPLHNVALQRILRGHIPTDVQKWIAVAPIRQVSRQWYEWAVNYAMRELYLSRWQGSER